jgi:hypothetical protein
VKATRAFERRETGCAPELRRVRLIAGTALLWLTVVYPRRHPVLGRLGLAAIALPIIGAIRAFEGLIPLSVVGIAPTYPDRQGPSRPLRATDKNAATIACRF